MNMSAIRLLAILASLALGIVACAAVPGAEVILPQGEIQPREYVILEVVGFTDQQLSMAVVDWSPKDGVQVLPTRSWTGKTQLLFKASTPGKYNVSVKTGVSAQAVLATAQAARIDPELAADLRRVVERIEAAYPPDAASATVTVAGAPEPPPIPDVVPVPAGKRRIVILHEQADDSVKFAALKVQLRDGANAKWLAERGHSLLILDKDATDQNGKPDANVKSWLSLVGGKVPSIVVVDISTQKVVHSSELKPDETAAGVVELVKRTGG